MWEEIGLWVDVIGAVALVAAGTRYLLTLYGKRARDIERMAEGISQHFRNATTRTARADVSAFYLFEMAEYRGRLAVDTTFLHFVPLLAGFFAICSLQFLAIQQSANATQAAMILPGAVSQLIDAPAGTAVVEGSVEESGADPAARVATSAGDAYRSAMLFAKCVLAAWAVLAFLHGLARRRYARLARVVSASLWLPAQKHGDKRDDIGG